MMNQPQQPNRPQQPQEHPMFEGRKLLNQLPITPHTHATHHLLQHAVPIFHQLQALKKALGAGKTGSKGNPGGMQNAI